MGDFDEFLLFFCRLRLNGTGDDESGELMEDESVVLMEDSVTTSPASFSPSESEEKRASAYVLLSLSLLFAVVMAVL